MPAEIVSGQDLDDVAAYVGMYAGVPGAAPPEGARRPRRPGLRQQRLRRLPHPRRRQIGRRRPAPTSTKSCPARAAAMIHEDDRRPEQRHRQGLPAERDARRTSSRRSPPKELEQLVEYLIESTAGGKGPAGSKSAGG